MANYSTGTSKKEGKSILRFLPLLVLITGALIFVYFDGASYINLDTLKQQRENLTGLVDKLGLVAPFMYGALYAVVVAFSLPLGAVMTITAGFLFGVVVGTITVVVGATIGATAIFLAIQMGLGKSLASKGEGWVAKMKDGFNRNAFSYLLALRLIPVFPFALVNIVPALLGVSLSVYFVATLLGIIPGSFVYILLGDGLGAIFDAGGTPNLSIIFEPRIILPILALAALVLLQVGYRYVQDKMKSKASKEAPKKTKEATSKTTKKKTQKRIKSVAAASSTGATKKTAAKKSSGKSPSKSPGKKTSTQVIKR